VARERWFWAQARQRRGPCALVELADRVLGQPDPGSVLVWRRGLEGWTRAEDVPELRGWLRTAGAADARRPGGPSTSPAAEPAPAPVVVPAGSNLAVYGGLAAGIAVLALVAWIFWPRERPPAAVPLGGAAAESAPAAAIPADAAPTAAPTAVPSASAPAATGTASGPGPAAGGVAARETTLPAAELRKLRGVAAWSGDRLRLTVFNGTAWRVTRIDVRLSRFDGEELVDDTRPLPLVPPGPAVEAGVDDLLSKVAPDRRKPGVNALDTGPFEGLAGTRPENFRWRIESARGYAPR
jgi:hypothetical protein